MVSVQQVQGGGVKDEADEACRSALCVAIAILIAINDQVSWLEWSASEDTALNVEARRMQQNP